MSEIKPDGTELFERLDAIKGVPLVRLRELAEAERKKKAIILNEIFETPRGDFGFIFYNEHNLLMGTFHPTREQAARALAEKGDAT